MCTAGEIVAGYADGCLTREQTVLVAYHRGRMAPDAGITGGLMAAAGLSAADAAARIQKEGCTDVVVGCDNSPVGVTLSGRIGNSDDIRVSRNLYRGIASHRIIFCALGIAAPWDALFKMSIMSPPII